MRLKEAHKIIKSMMERASDRERRALRVAEIHMEKGISKKTMTEVRKMDTWIGRVVFKAGTKVHRCPNCKIFVTGSDRYCRNCGQRIIW
ncbi:MAG: hypothetical protein KHY39_05005 [Clostridiaceae bacterium]|nr:hypothetical protein [Clostridiaceae bacterium]